MVNRKTYVIILIVIWQKTFGRNNFGFIVLFDIEIKNHNIGLSYLKKNIIFYYSVF